MLIVSNCHLIWIAARVEPVFRLWLDCILWEAKCAALLPEVFSRQCLTWRSLDTQLSRSFHDVSALRIFMGVLSGWKSVLLRNSEILIWRWWLLPEWRCWLSQWSMTSRRIALLRWDWVLSRNGDPLNCCNQTSCRCSSSCSDVGTGDWPDFSTLLALCCYCFQCQLVISRPQMRFIVRFLQTLLGKCSSS